MMLQNVRIKKIGLELSGLLYKVFRLVILLGLSYLMLHPVLTMISLSITTADDLFGSSVWIPSRPTFTNFSNLLVYFDYAKHAFVSLRAAFFGTIIQLTVCSLVGYGLARYRFKGNGLVFAMVLTTIIVPVQTAQIPLYLEYRAFDFFGIGKLIGMITGTPLTVNLVSTNWVYYLPAMFGVGLRSGLYIFLFRQFFKGLPKDLEEAGQVDGCNPIKIFIRIVLPNTKPVFVTVALLSFVYYWNDMVIGGMLLNTTDAMPIMVYLNSFDTVRRQVEDATGELLNENIVECFAAVLMTVSPLTIVYIICQKFFVECMDRSGIKG